MKAGDCGVVGTSSGINVVLDHRLEHQAVRQLEKNVRFKRMLRRVYRHDWRGNWKGLVDAAANIGNADCTVEGDRQRLVQAHADRKILIVSVRVRMSEAVPDRLVDATGRGS